MDDLAAMDQPPEPPYVLEDQIGFKLRLANQRHLELFSEVLPEVTPTQFSTLFKLWEQGALSQNHLGRLVAMDAATTKGVVDRLRTRGLVATAASESDRRRLDVSLTPAGLALITAGIARARQISDVTTKPLSPDERALLLSFLDRLSR